MTIMNGSVTKNQKMKQYMNNRSESKIDENRKWYFISEKGRQSKNKIKQKKSIEF